jgi:hypothetical protein
MSVDTFESYETPNAVEDTVTVVDNPSFDDMEMLERQEEAANAKENEQKNDDGDTKKDQDTDKNAEKSKKEDGSDKYDSERDSSSKDEQEDGDKDREKESDKKSEDGDKEDDSKVKEEQGKPGRPKKIKGKVGDEEVELDPKTEIPIKVGGKTVMKTLQEIRNGESSRIHINEELEKIKSERTEIHDLKEQYENEKNVVVGHMQKVIDMINQVENSKDDDSVDPLGPMKYLLELSGKNSYDYIYEHAFKSMLDEFEEISEMTEVERRAHFAEKKADHLENFHKSKEQRLNMDRQNDQYFKEVENLRVANGLSEDDFCNAYDDLVQLGVNEDEIKPEHVINQHQKMSSIDRAESLISKVNEKLKEDDDVVIEISELIYNNKKLTDDKIIKFIEANWGKSETVDDELQQLNDKIEDDTPPEQPRKTKEDHIETFDDFNVYQNTYGN